MILGCCTPFKKPMSVREPYKRGIQSGMKSRFRLQCHVARTLRRDSTLLREESCGSFNNDNSEGQETDWNANRWQYTRVPSSCVSVTMVETIQIFTCPRTIRYARCIGCWISTNILFDGADVAYEWDSDVREAREGGNEGSRWQKTYLYDSPRHHIGWRDFCHNAERRVGKQERKLKSFCRMAYLLLFTPSPDDTDDTCTALSD